MNYKIPLLVLLLALPISVRAGMTIEQLIEQARLVESESPVSEAERWRNASKIVVWDRGIDIGDLAEDVEIVLVGSPEEALQHVVDADAIVGYCSREIVEAAPLLVWVQIYWAGVERCLEVEQIASGEVVLSNMQKMSSPAIAEHAIAMALSLSRKLPSYARAMEDRNWLSWGGDLATEMRPIAGRTLLVVGLGGIGSEVARLGDALGMRVVGTRNSSRTGPDYVDYVGLSDELHELAADADIIVNALPLTAATTGLLDAEFFDATKSGAIFVNVGRGATVVTSDLMAALDSGQISGAGLDVTEPEPLPQDHALWDYDNVVVTPHVAGAGGENERHRLLLLENLRRYIGGERLLNVVDPQKGY
ncbi:MAG: D-2-hydroxyacid dehydrogenase [Gammaproteobacteria bacterium]|nr:D-2-hydroxyacid dehydrogenase [Gammaproteobacteria bacterium]